jgi:hypothetical protein
MKVAIQDAVEKAEKRVLEKLTGKTVKYQHVLGSNMNLVQLANGHKHMKTEGVYGDLWPKIKEDTTKKAEDFGFGWFE